MAALTRVLPVPMRLLPDRLKASVWARWYHPPAVRWWPLFSDAPLRFAPGVRMDLVPIDVISSSIAFTGFWELRLSRLLVRLARSGGTMIDVGANLGYFSLLWAAANSANRCFAFEASPRNADRFRHNVGRNHLESRIRFFSLAAGREKGRMPFDLGPPEQTGWGGFTTAERGDSTVTVDVVRVDDMVDADAPVRLLKLDVEGADAWALMGCEKLLRQRRVACVWFEQNKPRMRELGIAEDEPVRFLASLGYVATPRSAPSGTIVDWLAVPGA